MIASNRITLRPIAPQDEAFLEALYGSTRADELALLDWDDDAKAGFIRMQFHAQHRSYLEAHPHAAFQIVLLDGAPVGRLYVDRTPEAVHVLDISLLPVARDQGLGTRLLHALMDEALGSDRAVTIYVEIFNRAQRLYERLGFQPVTAVGLYRLMRWTNATGPNLMVADAS
jgi:RimJ/RimL family protein N-acetyltransferase